MSDILEWAKREVEIACEKENPNRRPGEFDYGCACYESALKAYKSLCEDGHSGFSIKMTQSILNRLLNDQPLTPIEDVDDVWDKSPRPKDGPELYQCKRMSSLFKTVKPDGSVTYDDVHRVICISLNNHLATYRSGLVNRIINEMFPITMPYMPGEPIKVYCEDFLVNEKNGDFDTVGVFYALKTEDCKEKRIEINKFFGTSEDEPNKFVEISKEKYDELKVRRVKYNGI